MQGPGRLSALAVSSALGGVCAFLSTCLMSPVVAYIQRQNNRLLGLNIYPAQFVSAVAFAITVLLLIYRRLVIINKQTKA